ncbi:MAG: TonB family protein [Acidobacteriota bacterium]|nr:TonB family protein [Acidobacteriota bacterium]MDH3530682.1 TonB family protein [Acidobacteriota bacterium]
MKHCPTCQTEYDEEVILFCTKDGTPLVDKEQPVFTDKMPSESSAEEDDDEGAQTIIRRKSRTAPGTESLTPHEASESASKPDSQRIVIDTSQEKTDQRIRPKAGVPRHVEPPKRSNTAIVVLLTIIATVLILLGVFAVYWLLTGNDAGENSNININENMDINGNLNTNDNFNLEDLNLNSNLDDNFNLNSNSNFNLSTPTPTKTPTPTPTPDESPSPSPSVSPSVTPTAAPTATPGPTRIATPTPPPKTPNTNSTVNIGTINGRAVRLPTPAYPSEARNARAAGRVAVAVTIDTDGNVIAARAVNGHPLLRASAEAAARKSKFRPVSVNGRAVAANGTILYNFVN